MVPSRLMAPESGSASNAAMIFFAFATSSSLGVKAALMTGTWSGWMASFPVRRALGVLKPELAAQVEPQEILEPTRRAFRAVLDAGELHAQIHTWIATYLECCILAKVDRASMMHSLEVRAPFLDPQVAEDLTSLPPQLIFRRGRGKVLLKSVAESLLPEPLLRKPKKGLGVPLSTWFRTVLRDRLEEALARSRAGGWFSESAMRALRAEHLAGRYDHRKALWSFLVSSPFQNGAA